MIRTAVAALLALVVAVGNGSATPVPVEKRRPAETRYEFVYSSGVFTKGPGQEWVERRTNGPESRFVEVERTPGYIELDDPVRNIRVRLHADRGEWQGNPNGRWVRWPGSEGGWRK